MFFFAKRLNCKFHRLIYDKGNNENQEWPRNTIVF